MSDQEIFEIKRADTSPLSVDPWPDLQEPKRNVHSAAQSEYVYLLPVCPTCGDDESLRNSIRWRSALQLVVLPSMT